MQSRHLPSLAFLVSLLAGCAAPGSGPASPGEPDLLLLGERHDAPGQIALVTDELNRLAASGHLAALAIEMAPAGTSTVALARNADAPAVRKALAWGDKSWPWDRYAPAIMAAVSAGVPVLGANLPQDQIQTAMADVSLDAQLSEPAREKLSAELREGHCNLLPESRIPAMLRVQVARDRSMAHTLAESAVPGKTAVLLSGAGHADTALGVPQHLPTQLTLRSIAMVAAGDPGSGQFDTRWATPAAPSDDPCAGLALNLRDKPAR